jgi:AcrR family transcriptional regulator
VAAGGSIVSQLRGRRSVDERREQLIDATLGIIASDGLAAATTRRITDEAGLALGAFHYAFRSKDELLRAVIQRFTDEITGVMDEVTVAKDDMPSAVEAIIRGLWDYAERFPEQQLAQYELTIHALRDPDMRELASWYYDRIVDIVVHALDGVAGAPDGQDRVELARFLVAALDGLILTHCVQGDLTAARRRLEQCVASARDADWSRLHAEAEMAPEPAVPAAG